MTRLLRGLLLAAIGSSWAILPITARAAGAKSDSRDRAAAVALNYCRASFHRIRKYQSKRVLVEEEEKILNNLDLTMIDDKEVVQLYSAVLDEISEIQIAEQEKKFFKDQYRRTLQRQLGLDFFVLAGQVATGQFASALRTGVNSWWDYRDLGLRRDLDVWKVERQRINGVMDKSSRFLETFWQVAKKRNIPDRWLVRGDDLDRLEQALQEDDLAVRLRVLKRMEPFMECYPPYWYHVARTQQALGQLYAAADTYQRLADLAAGHFRKDDMLAAAMANLAMIQEYLDQPEAVETAREALGYSTDVWQANLMCAYILQRHGLVAEAEDAILRNLDVGLEESQSRLALLALYLRWDKLDKLAAMLQERERVEQIPVIFLLKSAQKLGDRLPQAARQYLRSSLYGYLDLHFGPDDFVLVAAPNWQLQNARMSLVLGAQQFTAAQGDWSGEEWQVRFSRVGEFGSDLRPRWEQLTRATLWLYFPAEPAVQVELAQSPASQTTEDWSRFSARPVANTRPHHWLQVVGVRLGEHLVPLAPAKPTPGLEADEVNGAEVRRPRAPRAPSPAAGEASERRQTTGGSLSAALDAAERPAAKTDLPTEGRPSKEPPVPPAPPTRVAPRGTNPSKKKEAAVAQPPTIFSAPASDPARSGDAGSSDPDHEANVAEGRQQVQTEPVARPLNAPVTTVPPPDYPARWSRQRSFTARRRTADSAPGTANRAARATSAVSIPSCRPGWERPQRFSGSVEVESAEVEVLPAPPLGVMRVPPVFVVPGPAAGFGRAYFSFGRPPALAPPAPGGWD